MKTQYLVTGGGGFIGSNILRRLLSNGQNVRVLDDFSTGRRENLAGIENDVELIEGDIRDNRPAEKGVEGRSIRSTSCRDSFGGALRRGSAHDEQRERVRHAENIDRGSRRGRRARRVLLVLVGLWRHADSAEAGEHEPDAAIALRSVQADGRILTAACSATFTA